MNKWLAKMRRLTPVEQMLYDMKLAFMRENGKTIVLGDVFLSGRGLTKLPDMSGLEVRGSFYCNNNNLKSLLGAPRTVKGVFECHDNPLDTLEDAPQKFRSLKSDFGTFANWDDIPKDVQLTDEGRARAYNERATVLEDTIRIKKPIRIKLKPAK